MLKKKFFVLMTVLILLVSSFVFSAEQTLVILHTNDIHGRILEGAYDGMGFDRISSVVNKFRTEYENVLLLDAGDTIHGLPISNINQGADVVAIMNAIGYEAMTAGNHDFNYGSERLVELDKISKFPILAANVFNEDGENILPSFIIKDFNGIKVGIFGLATPETLYKSHPAGTKGLTFEEPAITAQKMVDRLRGRVDFLIALVHLGIDETTLYEDSTYSVADIDGIDLIVDGHSHTLLKNGMYINDTLVVQTQDYGKNVGVVKVTFKDQIIMNMEASLFEKVEAMKIPADTKIVSLVAEIVEKQEDMLSEVIGTTLIQLEGRREFVRAGETNLGNLITDAIVDFTKADFAVTNGGGIRTSINQGDITIRDVYTVLPFGNYVVTVPIKGYQIKEILEIGAAGYPAPVGGFLHVSGLSYMINVDGKANDRVVNIVVKGRPINMDETYLMATNDFLAAGGDGLSLLADLPIIAMYPGMESIVAEYIAANSPINSQIEGRIIGISAYTLKQGEWLAKVAAEYGISWKTLAEINNIEDPNTVFVGQEILVPILK